MYSIGNKSPLSYFDQHTQGKAKEYTNGRVLSCVKNDTEITGRILGTKARIYESNVRLTASGASVVFTSCSCPVQFDCKHTAALLMHYLGTLGTEKVDKRPPIEVLETKHEPRVTIIEEPRSNVPSALDHSLRYIRNLCGPVDSNSSSPTDKTLLYVLNERRGYKPHIEAAFTKKKRDGTWTHCVTHSLDSVLDKHSRWSRSSTLLSDSDEKVAILWTQIVPSYSFSAVRDYADADAFAILMERVLSSGRAYLDRINGLPLHLGPPLPGRFVWVPSGRTEDDIILRLRAFNDDREFHCLHWYHPWYVDHITGACGRVLVDVPPGCVEALQELGPIKQRDFAKLPMKIAQLGLHTIIPVPPGQKPVNVRKAKVEPRVDIVRKAAVQLDPTVHIKSKIPVLTVAVPHEMQDSKRVIEEDGQIIVEETTTDNLAQYINQLATLGFKQHGDPVTVTNQTQRFEFSAPPASWQALDEQVAEYKSAGWIFSEEAEEYLVPTLVDEIEGDITFGGSEWWFSLELDVEIDGKKQSLLPILSSALAELPRAPSIAESISQLGATERFVTFTPDGKLISLPSERVKSLLLVLHELLEGASKKVSVSGLLANNLLSIADANWSGLAQLRSLAERLRKLTELKPAPTPSNFNATLRPYQSEGLAWLNFLAEEGFGGILADDMGLGKTIELLAHICAQKQNGKLTKPFLVVCPTSVLPNWLAEIERFAPHLRVVSYRGPNRRECRNDIATAEVVLSTYPILLRDAPELSKQEWCGIAMDESQTIKNDKAAVTLAARKLRADYRLCLSGTPIENHLGELWSHFHFLAPGLLGDKDTFNRKIRNPIEKFGRAEVKEALSSRIRPFILRRTKEQVASDLPDKVTIVQSIELTSAQAEIYETVRLAMTELVKNQIASSGFRQSQIVILKALLRLRQTCCDPRLVPDRKRKSNPEDSAKLTHLMEMLEQLVAEDRRILLFSQFTSMLNFIEDELEQRDFKYVRICGSTKDRVTPVQRFQSGEVPIFLISLKAGGTGLNLTAADVVIHYDPWWNPAVEDQATDRAHRIGQTKKVMVYKLIAQGTIEQRMQELQERKRILANSIYDEDGSRASLVFTEEDLESLLRPIDSKIQAIRARHQ